MKPASHPRREFLSALFRILEQKAAPYCVLRNYQNIYDDGSSDVDLVVEPEWVERVGDCLAEAAASSGYLFAHRARHICYSAVFWHPAAGFLRIDIQKEVRWGIFPVLAARSVVERRRKQGDFYIPHPADESVILYVAAIWRGYLSDRYREQLAGLYPQMTSPEELRRTFTEAFGVIGQELATYQTRLPKECPRPGIWKAARRSIIRRALHDWPRKRALLGYLAEDVGRLWQRLWRPPGISLVCASSAQPARDMDEFFEQIKFVYPKERVSLHRFRVAAGAQATIRPLSFRLRLRRLYVLLKGGVFVLFYELSDDVQIQQVFCARTRQFYGSRAFVWAENSRLQTCLGHVETGFMADFSGAGGARVSHDQVMLFIAAILEQSRRPTRPVAGGRGVFVVLAGLDGSGKTTVARQLCCLGPEQQRFRRIRYFHWQPRITRDTIFPLPEYRNLPRKLELRRNLFRSVLSVARLSKNVLLSNLAHWIRVAPLLRGNALVVVDRYFYNYFLDPVSVKYYGPVWLLDWVRPLYPRPDLVIALKAPPEVLLSRKQELTQEEILRQSAVLQRLRFLAGRTVEADAARPPAAIARTILQEIVQTAP